MSEAEPPEPRSSARSLRALIPYLITGLIAVALSLLAQQLLVGQPRPAAPTPTSAPTQAALAAAAPTEAPVTPRATAPAPDERVLGQELLDLRDLGERRASFVYLLKAEALLRLAEEALVQNNLSEVDRTLLDVDVTFARAYERSADSSRSPILQLREQLSLIHDDLYVRPEGIDQRLRRLRQSTLSLVDEVP